MNLASDFEFAQQEDGDLPTAAAVLRYVAAINLEATRDEFVAAAIAAGYPGNSAANRFRESRACSVEMEPDLVLQKDGRLLETTAI